MPGIHGRERIRARNGGRERRVRVGGAVGEAVHRAFGVAGVRVSEDFDTGGGSCRQPAQADGTAQPRGVERRDVHRQGMEAVLQGGAGEREGRRRGEDEEVPGGASLRLRFRRRPPRQSDDRGRGASREQHAPGHQPVRGARGRARGALRRDGADERPPCGACGAEEAGRRDTRGFQPDKAVRARRVLGGRGAFRVGAGVRDFQRDRDEVLRQHDARQPSARDEECGDQGRQEDVQQLRVHELVGGREEQTDHRLEGFREDVLRAEDAAERPYAVLRVHRRGSADGDAPVPDCGHGAHP